jgi:hypothetical protein
MFQLSGAPLHKEARKACMGKHSRLQETLVVYNHKMFYNSLKTVKITTISNFLLFWKHLSRLQVVVVDVSRMESGIKLFSALSMVLSMHCPGF